MIPALAVPGKNTRNAVGENKGTVLLFPSPCFAYEYECKWTETKGPSPYLDYYILHGYVLLKIVSAFISWFHGR